MVGSLVRSVLVDLPAPIPVAGLSTDNNADNANANPGKVDPWKNIFPVERCTHGGMGQDGFYRFIGGLGGHGSTPGTRMRSRASELVGRRRRGAFIGVWIVCLRFGVGFVRDVGGSILGM